VARNNILSTSSPAKIGGTLYIGVTNNLVCRVYEHREKLVGSFKKRCDVAKLVYFDVHSEVEAAITREKQMKKWNRAWKVRLIDESNPNWSDLYNQIVKARGFWMPAFAGMTVSEAVPLSNPRPASPWSI
jgi:putative endonuclease